MNNQYYEKTTIRAFVDIIWFPMRFFGLLYGILFLALFLKVDYEEHANFINAIGPPAVEFLSYYLGWFLEFPTVIYGALVFAFWFFFYWIYTIHGLFISACVILYHILNSILQVYPIF
ncbi:hypothetical protein [Desulfohalobium retbaense]|uniref:Uncharacterized protein n=1 Tax=Desulfohalobium retbaense (strain ATCC 49708 / DSM 5692 / JCM 16813 / HR100) TaxID=485915 RepID=C8X5X9_DESRD|nr:hypothetical protein [Desulfohalobium retbaense]ACV69826.1 hypothetical protein Dret_2550 [Desulfohalobium retbaense DSM 5692]